MLVGSVLRVYDEFIHMGNNKKYRRIFSSGG